ncbi:MULTISPECIES: DUF92 domain-containing protein [Halococcus]|uniref:DUF92 domain-containing protein n=1 Tax=Halococcus salifodinae DSM 8989 TaxID=1227456 RepID=M0MTU3_9EURY|nr:MULTISPECIES: DUF92 domain-containing protein [Halococcus]EMA49152.1 hypothetical protein C450_17843 [Halococcus salifodinae DSM 8989]
MTSTVRRAGAFALVGALSLAAPFLGPAIAAPFVLIAGLAAFVIDDGPVFELFARSGDRQERTLYGLAGFALAIAGLALFASVFEMPTFVFVASVLVLSGGTLAEAVAQEWRGTPIAGVVGFVVGGTLTGAAGQLAVGLAAPAPLPALAVFYAASGALLGALVRSVLFERDDPLVLFSMGLLLWLLAALEPSVPATGIGLALAVTAGFGYLAYALDTASIPGMVTGVLSGLLMIVLGGFGWFALLIAFFAGGGLATKFRYDRKRQRGIAEDDGGARGSGNVLANAAVALAAVLGYAAAPLHPVGGELFRFVFAGSIAAAMADTLSSEIGGLYDTPRLITTLEPVPPGTDGGVTWQGVVAGLGGAALVAGLAALVFDVTPAGAAIIAAAGVAGMIVDSLLGALFENQRFDSLLPGTSGVPGAEPGGGSLGSLEFDNRTVNFLATLAAAMICAALAVSIGLAPG